MRHKNILIKPNNLTIFSISLFLRKIYSEYQYFIIYIFKYFTSSLLAMPNEISDEELEAELDKAFKENEAKRDQCGAPIPSNQEVGIQRTNVKIKKDK